MALTITNVGTGTNLVSASTAMITLVTAAVDDVLVVAISASNSGTNGASCISSVQASNGQTFDQISIINRDPGAADAGTTLGLYRLRLTSAMTLGTITVSYSPNCTLSAIAAQRIQPAAGHYPEYLRNSGAAYNGDANSFSFTTDSIAAGETVFAVIAIETDDTFTGDGSWSSVYSNLADTGGDADSQFVAVQHKTGSGTTVSWNTSTSGGTRDYAKDWLVFKETPVARSASIAVTLSNNTPATTANGAIVDVLAVTLADVVPAVVSTGGLAAVQAATLDSIAPAVASTAAIAETVTVAHAPVVHATEATAGITASYSVDLAAWAFSSSAGAEQQPELTASFSVDVSSLSFGFVSSSAIAVNQEAGIDSCPLAVSSTTANDINQSTLSGDVIGLSVTTTSLTGGMGVEVGRASASAVARAGIASGTDVSIESIRLEALLMATISAMLDSDLREVSTLAALGQQLTLRSIFGSTLFRSTVFRPTPTA